VEKFSFERVGTANTSCYTVLGAARTVIGQVRKEGPSRLWRAEQPEGTKDFSTRDEAALWLVGRRALRTPPAERRLAFDPTPAGLIVAPLRIIHKSLWGRLRQERFKVGDLSCDICGAYATEKKLIDAHEVYSFPSPNTIHLDQLIFVCRACHYAIHFDRTIKRCSAGYIKEIQKHYMKVNGDLTMEEFHRDFDHSQRRSLGLRDVYRETERSVKLDFGPYQSCVDALIEKRMLQSELLANDEDSEDDDDSDFEMYPDHECPWDIGKAD
jgi:hypothetical protein